MGNRKKVCLTKMENKNERKRDRKKRDSIDIKIFFYN